MNNNNPTVTKPRNPGARNRSPGIIGNAYVRCLITNATSATIAVTAAATGSGAVQPSSRPSVSATATPPSSTMARNWPGRSWGSRAAARARGSSRGMCAADNHNVTSTIGTLTRKMLRQPIAVTRAPPRMGPNATGLPATIAHTATALARSFGSR